MRNPFENAALIRCVVLDGRAVAASVVRNRSRGRRIRFVGGCDFTELAVGLRTPGRSPRRSGVIERVFPPQRPKFPRALKLNLIARLPQDWRAVRFFRDLISMLTPFTPESRDTWGT